MYAWQQKEYAEAQRDEANQFRLARRTVLNERVAALANVQGALDELKRYNPESAATIGAKVAVARAEATKELADLDRWASCGARRWACEDCGRPNSNRAMLRDENARLADRLARVQADIVMPRLDGMSLNAATKALARLQLTVGRVVRQSVAASNGIACWANGRFQDAKLPRGAVVDLLVSDGNKSANIELPVDVARATTDEQWSLLEETHRRFLRRVVSGERLRNGRLPGRSSVAGVRREARCFAAALAGAETTIPLRGFAPGRGSMIEGTVLDQGGKAMSRVAVSIVKK